LKNYHFIVKGCEEETAALLLRATDCSRPFRWALCFLATGLSLLPWLVSQRRRPAGRRRAIRCRTIRQVIRGHEMLRDLSSIRRLPNLDGCDDVVEFDLTSQPETISVGEVLSLLKSVDEADREEAIAILSDMVDTAYGEDGARLGEAVREGGGVEVLARLLSDRDEVVQQAALGLIGNLCSDAVDANSVATKRALLPYARSVLSCVYTSDVATLCLACGALQNLTAERGWAEVAVSHDVHLRLEQLVVSHRDSEPEGHIVRYSSGALRNITASGALDLRGKTTLSPLAVEAISARATRHRIESLEQQRARAVLAKAISCISPERRQQRHELGVRRRRHTHRLDTASDCDSSTTWSYEIGPFIRSRDQSRDGSRPASACSLDSRGSHASYRTASSLRAGTPVG